MLMEKSGVHSSNQHIRFRLATLFCPPLAHPLPCFLPHPPFRACGCFFGRCASKIVTLLFGGARFAALMPAQIGASDRRRLAAGAQPVGCESWFVTHCSGYGGMAYCSPCFYVQRFVVCLWFFGVSLSNCAKFITKMKPLGPYFGVMLTCGLNPKCW